MNLLRSSQTGFFAAFLLLSSAHVALAQENLPDLAPQVVEITGDLTISFPSLRRQPLAGFNPPPRVPDIAADRKPYVDIYKQEGSDLPASPLTAPSPPSMSSVASRKPATGIIEAGVGRYTTGYVKGNLSAPIGVRSTFLARANISGTSGREPFSGVDHVSTGRDSQSGGAGLRTDFGGVHAGADIDLSRDAYELFGAIPVDTSSVLTSPDRTVSDWLGSVFLSYGAISGTYATVKAGVGGSTVDTELINPDSALPDIPSTNENRVFVRSAAGIDTGTAQLNADLSLSRQTIDASGAGNKTVSSVTGAAGFRMDYSERVKITASARILGFSGDGQSNSGSDRDLLYFAPDFRIKFSVSPGFSLSIVDAPDLEETSYGSIFRQAPYVQDAIAFQPVLTSTNLYGEALFSNEKTSLRARVGFKDIQNYRVIEHDGGATTPYSIGYMAVTYEDASIAYLEADLMVVIISELTTSLSATYRNGNLSASDKDIPYFSPFGLSAFLTVDPFDGGFILKGSVRVESSRYRDREKTEKIGSTLGVGVEGAYFLTEKTAAVVGVRHLGQKTEFWENYKTDSGVFYAGLRWRW